MTPSLRDAALEVHNLATSLGHSLAWRELSTRFEARCTDPRCCLKVTVEDDGHDRLTHANNPPSCPLLPTLS